MGGWLPLPQKGIDDGQLSRIKKQSNYSYIGLSKDREKAVEYANNHMAKEQRDDDSQDDSAMAEIIFSAKGVALYGITLADNVRSPMPMFRKHCHKNCKDDEGKWHLLIDIPLNQKIDSGERIVTILWWDFFRYQYSLRGQYSKCYCNHGIQSAMVESPVYFESRWMALTWEARTRTIAPCSVSWFCNSIRLSECF